MEISGRAAIVKDDGGERGLTIYPWSPDYRKYWRLAESIPDDLLWGEFKGKARGCRVPIDWEVTGKSATDKDGSITVEFRGYVSTGAISELRRRLKDHIWGRG